MTELNDNKLPVDSPIAQNGGAVSAYDFDSNTDRNSVSFAKIKNFSFNAGTGGTLTLGGFGNGSGQLIIKNDSGNVLIVADSAGFSGYTGTSSSIAGTLGVNINYQLDESGLSIYNGSINIYNNEGTTILDEFGLNSQNNFPFSASSSGGANQTINTYSGSYTDIVGGSLTFVLRRETTLTFNYGASVFPRAGTADTGDGRIYFDIDGTISGPEINFTTNYFSAFEYYTYSYFHLQTLSAGTHTIKIKGDVQSPSGTPVYVVYNYRIQYNRLGE